MLFSAVIVSDVYAYDTLGTDGADTIILDGQKISGDKCDITKEDTKISIRYFDVGDNPKKLKTRFDDTLKNIESLAKKAGATELIIEDMNYDISSERGQNRLSHIPSKDSKYQLSGNIGYDVLPASSAIDVMTAIEDANLEAKLSSKSRRIAKCAKKNNPQ